MDEGVVLYLVIFLILAVVQGIGQKRKEAERKSRSRPRESPEPELPPGSPESRPVPGAGPATRHRPATTSRPGPATTSKAGSEASSSEGMIPSEVWEEILGLARGKPPVPKPSGPKPQRPPDEPWKTRPAPRGPEPVGPRAESQREAERQREREVEIYRAPGSLEEIPSFEARSLEDLHPRGPETASRRLKARAALTMDSGILPLPVQGRKGPDRGRDIRCDLRGVGSKRQLRRAVILSEVLSPPVSLRD